MTSQPLDADMVRQLDELGDKGGAPASWREVRDVVESILGTMDGDLQGGDVKLFAEIEALARFIRTAKSEIAALRPEQIGAAHIDVATDELDAVVKAAEDATNSIMEAAETIEEVGERLDDGSAESLSDATTKIYEACSFQDISGQRIAKVINALKEIDSRVEAIVATFEVEGDGAEDRRSEVVEPVGAAPDGDAEADGLAASDLLQGPQLPDQANNQDEIDALFDGMG